MAYNVLYKKSVQRDLRKLPKAEISRLLGKIERKLAQNPESNPVLKGRFAGLRKLRAGDYRVVYAILETEVLVLRISHRKEGYRRSPRLEKES